ncbi:beta-N-acetylglucosaminidase domain-containing protein [bacterium]|nr:beta-N-acetylglucosaminidase domain-containing protein [bacterium]
MKTSKSTGKYLCGVIEGFYGRPWSWSNRLILLQQLHSIGLNTYMYAPKFDLNHRWKWKTPYPDSFINSFRELCGRGRKLGINIILSLSPGLSVSPVDAELLAARFADLAETEPAGLALLMDDIPYSKADAARQCKLVLHLHKILGNDFQMFFCPTAYSRWHMQNWDKASDYLKIIGAEIPDSWQIFWTGNTVISKTINSSNLEDIRRILTRNPIIWDNFSADDYVPACSAFPGPLTNRSADLLQTTSGLLLNPSEIFSMSQIAVYSLSSWFHNPQTYVPEKAFEEAITKICPDQPDQRILQEFLGYFYTPFGISSYWMKLMEKITAYLKNSESSENPENELISIRKRLRNDENINRFGTLWADTYPLLRTLLGDLDYLISACRKKGSGVKYPDYLPPRDPRWSTPVNDLIRSLLL